MKNKLLYLATIALTFISCEQKATFPTVVTGDAIVYATAKTVQLNGYVESDGGDVVTERGICYVTSSSGDVPTISNNVVSAGSGKGSFSAILERVEPGTYTYRAYATNDIGTSYGDIKYFKMTTTGKPNDDPKDDPDDGGKKYTINDFLGTYSLKAYNWDAATYETWSGVKIKTYNTDYWSNAVYVEGLVLGEGYTCFRALGQFDAEKQCIRLFSGWQFTNRTFTFTGEDISYIARFYPVYANKNEDTFTYLYSGNGYEGCAEAWLTFNSNGKLCLGASDTPDPETGKYANGMVFRYSEAENPTNYNRFEVFIEVEMTKTSNTASMPEKAPYKIDHADIINTNIEGMLHKSLIMKSLKATKCAN
jgi:hypothetical protein